MVAFIRRYNLRMRAKQRNKRVAKTDFGAALQKCHATMRERRIRTGKDDRYDDKWRRFILNVDQSPLPFAVYSETTYTSSHKMTSTRTKSGLVSLVVSLNNASAQLRCGSDQMVIRLDLASFFGVQANKSAMIKRQLTNPMLTVSFKKMHGRTPLSVWNELREPFLRLWPKKIALFCLV